MKGTMASNPPQLPEFWQVLHSRTHNKVYYFNTKTSESRWEPPQVVKPSHEPPLSTSISNQSDRPGHNVTRPSLQHASRPPKRPFPERDGQRIDHFKRGPISSKESPNLIKPITYPTEELDNDQIRIKHILIKHKDSQDPTNWKKDNIVRTKKEAEELAKSLRDMIISKKVKFEDAVTKDSDCLSALHGGVLNLKRGRMSKAFDCTAFMLRVGEISQPVLTPNGVYLISRVSE
ncbi:Peptidyl-prolyl cis-trans isomerase NIMA-interacting protein 1 [Basidiobolus ranarum]|uniref:Peptidyl-prolyl cis-trans isomerase n=1 Tax=Basidiobolus ranarum TaxID=34480 RepID=A0ABR2WQN4_9FUNG